MLKQSILELTNAINNGKKNNDPKDSLKVKMSLKNALDIMGYLKDLEDIKKKVDGVR